MTRYTNRLIIIIKLDNFACATNIMALFICTYC